jgi:hypothetical protein
MQITGDLTMKCEKCHSSKDKWGAKEKMERFDGLNFKKVKSTTSKVEANKTKMFWKSKGFWVRTECEGKDPETGKLHYNVYKHKKNAK